MKNQFKYMIMSALLIIAMTLFLKHTNAQTINWNSLKEENKHILNANIGIEHGAIFGIGYGYSTKAWSIPVIANVEYSFPSGNKVFDDFKTKMGFQIRWFEYHNFQFSTKIHGVFRRYENDYVRLLNFGSDLSGIIGYYDPKWFVAGEFGFDKAIVTHFKHSTIYGEQYASAVDGWYQPATGGNFYYGIQGGISIGKNDLTLKAGKIISQDFKTNPMVPFYFQVGYNIKF